MPWQGLADPFLMLAAAAAGVATTALAWFGAGLGLRVGGAVWPGPGEGRIARRLQAPLAALVGVAAGLAMLWFIQATLAPANRLWAARVFTGLALVFSTWAIVRLLRLAFEWSALRRTTLRPAARAGSRVLAVVLYAAALLAILATYGISITPLLAGLGIGALAVALALQDTMSNFFAGVWIQTEQPISPGNYVRVEGQNVEGFVEEVGWRTTRIRALAGNLVVLPNAKLAQATVTDYSLPDPSMSVVMTFRLPFDVDPQRAMAILVEEAKEAAKSTPGLLADPAPFANATPGVGDSSIGYSLIIKVREFVDQWNAQTAVTLRVWNRLQREGIRFAYPTRINLQGDGSEFVPERSVRPTRRPPRVPEGRDPREIEAEQARTDIAARQAQQDGADSTAVATPASAPPTTTPTPAQAQAKAASMAGPTAAVDPGKEKDKEVTKAT